MSDAPDWTRDGRDWPLAAHSRFVDAGGLRWHVQTLGEGPPLLLLHGTGAATHSWRDLAPRLATRFTVVAPDLPGHGFTRGRPAGGLALPAVAGAAGTLLDALDIAPRLVVGHSAGAAIGIRMALDGIVAPAGIVGLAAALQPFPGLAGRLFPSLARLLFVNPVAPHIFAAVARQPGETGRFLARSTGSVIDPRGAELYARLFARAGHVAGALGMMAAWDLEPLAKALPALDPPLLLVHGERDAAVPASAARAAADAAQAPLELLPALGHLAHEEAPDTAAALILGFAAAHGVVAEAQPA